ncbi:MAG TPA: single-stranded-DNA-specific exonuclease RecJ [Candidatus Kapabacteria bacterium]|nr:single-stranded-DNA-specific exonuclease RecJ [Candidatus Kapabacteria bacterium]
MEYRWRISDQPDEHAVQELARSLNQPDSIARILVSRGISRYEDAKQFFRPSLSDLHDPFMMRDMVRAVERVMEAIKSGAHIRVYGDYDVDGTTSTSMLFLFLKEAEANVSYYIPDRFTEGYGLSIAGVDAAHRAGVKLLITVDCGTTAVTQVAHARTLGMDVIVCDHHEPDKEIPATTALLNPIQPGCDYPFKYLSGCGVAFKLMQGLAQKLGIEEDRVLHYLDFVAVAAAADIVSLVGENRILVTYGLQLLNGDTRPGFRALLDVAGIEHGKVQTSTVVFGIAPRINAAGRIGDAVRAVRLLICDEPGEAYTLAQELETDNRSRRALDEETFGIAQRLIEETLDRGNDRVIVLHHGEWHPGVIGIVASRVVEKYYLPAVMLTTVEGAAKGSARSIPGFDIHSALRRCESMMINFGGHKYAAGLSLAPENVPAFRKALNEVAREMITPEMLIPEISADTTVNVQEINTEFVNTLKQFAPYGPQNMKPVFYVSGAEIVGTPRIVGNNHLKFRVRQMNGNIPTSQKTVVDAIGFGLGAKYPLLKNGRREFELLAAVEENTYLGKTSPQFLIKDLR